MDQSFYRNNLQSDISGKLSSLKKILILHGDADNLVPSANAREIYDKVGEPKKLIMQQGGNHRMSDKAHQKMFLQEAVLWFKKHLI